jgi:adenine phosphoribosyltransferase
VSESIEAGDVPQPVVSGVPSQHRVSHGSVSGHAGNGPVTPAVIADVIAANTVDVPDFPQPGVNFKDLTPLFANGPAFAQVIDVIATQYGGAFDVVAGIEARGFVLAAAVAYASGAGLVPIRKAGKLPRETVSAAYALEYGEAVLEVHADAFEPGTRVLLLDDVLATGGTAAAAISLVERAGGVVVGFSVLMELEFLAGRSRLGEREVHALLTV